VDRLIAALHLNAAWGTVASILLITLVALVTYLFLRLAADHVASRLLIRRREEDLAVLPQIELERRVGTLRRLAVRTGGAVIVIIGVLMALDTLSVNIGPAIAGLGVAGIAVGFGAQTLVRDWLAGIFIVLENQYSQGDVVRIAGVSGVVEDFSLRRTSLRDLDGAVHSVPNGQITVATNLTRVWSRVNLDIPVAYGTDIEDATRVIKAVGEKLHAEPEWSARMLEAPSVVRVNALGEFGVSLKVLGQVRAAEQWSVAGELRKRILAAFAEHGIRMPSTQRIVIGTPDAAPPSGDPDTAAPGDPTAPAGPP
jgi:moderate conductance mechanosensitive channel